MPLKSQRPLFKSVKGNAPQSIPSNRRQKQSKIHASPLQSLAFPLNMKKKTADFNSRQNKRPRILCDLKEPREVTQTISARVAVLAFVEITNGKRFVNRSHIELQLRAVPNNFSNAERKDPHLDSDATEIFEDIGADLARDCLLVGQCVRIDCETAD